jgi:hypothetical protein
VVPGLPELFAALAAGPLRPGDGYATTNADLQSAYWRSTCGRPPRPSPGWARPFVKGIPATHPLLPLNTFGAKQRDGRLRTNIGNVATLDDAVALNLTERISGQTTIRVRR